jgi:26S proteasome regulatory subunit N2
MEAVVNNMFRTCLDRLEIKQAIGIALEARRMDILREAVKRAPAQREMINYCKDVCMTLIQSREFRNQVCPVPIVSIVP